MYDFADTYGEFMVQEHRSGELYVDAFFNVYVTRDWIIIKEDPMEEQIVN